MAKKIEWIIDFEEIIRPMTAAEWKEHEEAVKAECLRLRIEREKRHRA